MSLTEILENFLCIKDLCHIVEDYKGYDGYYFELHNIGIEIISAYIVNTKKELIKILNEIPDLGECYDLDYSIYWDIIKESKFIDQGMHLSYNNHFRIYTKRKQCKAVIIDDINEKINNESNHIRIYTNTIPIIEGNFPLNKKKLFNVLLTEISLHTYCRMKYGFNCESEIEYCKPKI